VAFFETGFNPKLAGFFGQKFAKIGQSLVDVAKFWFQLQKILHTILMIVTKYYYFMVSSYHNTKTRFKMIMCLFYFNIFFSKVKQPLIMSNWNVKVIFFNVYWIFIYDLKRKRNSILKCVLNFIQNTT